MGKLIWHTVMSLDGFIAGPNDDMSWAFGVASGPSKTIERSLLRRERSWSAVERRTWRIASGQLSPALPAAQTARR